MTRATRTLLALVAAGALVLAACSSDDDVDTAAQGTTAPAGDPTPDDPMVDDTTPDVVIDGELQTLETAYGDALALDDGQVLYAFAADTENLGTCTGDCAAKWPPVVAAEVDGPDDLDLGSVERSDGITQLTVSGRPVYTFSGDLPGEATCQGGDGVWWILEPDGELNTTEP